MSKYDRDTGIKESKYIKSENAEKPNWLVCVMFVFLSTFFLYDDFSHYGLRRMYMFLLAILFAFMFISIRREISFDSYIFAFFLIIVPIILSFLGPDARIDQNTMAYALQMVVSFIYAMIAIPNKRTLDICRIIIWLSADLFAFIVLLSRFAPTVYHSTVYRFLSPGTRYYSDVLMAGGYSCAIGGSITYANYVFMLAFFFSFSFFLTNTQGNLGCFIRMLLYLLASFMTGRRGEILMLLITACIVIALVRPNRVKMKKIFISIIILVMIIIPFWQMNKESGAFIRLRNTVTGIEEGSDITNGRADLWNAAYELFREHPFTGVGWGGFAFYVPKGHLNVENVHNVYLQFLAETGILGTSMILAGFLFLMCSTTRYMLRIHKNVNDNYLLGLTAISMGIGVYFTLLGFIDPCCMKGIFWFFMFIEVTINRYVKHEYSSTIHKKPKVVQTANYVPNLQ